VPAFQDSPVAAALFSIPVVLVVWAVVLAFKMGPDANALSPYWKHLLIFYTVTGTVSVWASTWTFAREGHAGHIFDPTTTSVVICIFAIPIAHLLIARTLIKKDTETMDKYHLKARFQMNCHRRRSARRNDP